MGRGRPGKRRGETRAPTLRNKTHQKLVVEEKNAEDENEVVEEGVVGGEDDADLPRGDDKKADDAKAAREKEHPDKDKIESKGGEGSGGMEPMREMLDVPADPGGQRT